MTKSEVNYFSFEFCMCAYLEICLVFVVKVTTTKITGNNISQNNQYRTKMQFSYTQIAFSIKAEPNLYGNVYDDIT